MDKSKFGLTFILMDIVAKLEAREVKYLDLLPHICQCSQHQYFESLY